MKPHTLATLLAAALICLATGAEPSIEAGIAASEKRALALYPDSGKEGSPLWKAITVEIARLEKQKSPLLDDPDYPVMLAAKCAAKGP